MRNRYGISDEALRPFVFPLVAALTLLSSEATPQGATTIVSSAQRPESVQASPIIPQELMSGSDFIMVVGDQSAGN